MSESFLGEIRLFSFNYAPRGWLKCDGTILSIAQNQALFALLGTYYGGDGQTTFALPDLRGRTPVHQGQRLGSSHVMGEKSGQESVTLTLNTMPTHNHMLGVAAGPGTLASPSGNVFAAHRGGYSESVDAVLQPGTLAMVGGSQPHENRPPFLTLNYCICTQGIFPSRN